MVIRMPTPSANDFEAKRASQSNESQRTDSVTGELPGIQRRKLDYRRKASSARVLTDHTLASGAVRPATGGFDVQHGFLGVDKRLIRAAFVILQAAGLNLQIEFGNGRLHESRRIGEPDPQTSLVGLCTQEIQVVE